MGKRQDVEKYIIEQVSNIPADKASQDYHRELYTNAFKQMNNEEFDRFMNELKAGTRILQIIVPNGSDTKIDINRNIKIAKSLGYEFFQKVITGPTKTTPKIKTPIKHMVFDIPYRRTSQLLSKGVSAPEDRKSVDLTTGQVTNKSRGNRLSFPEVQILAGLGLKSSIVEMMKYRGGDVGGINAMDALLLKNGHVSQEVLEQYSTGVVSTRTLKSYLNAAHLSNTLTG
jgi:hypothetical protein